MSIDSSPTMGNSAVLAALLRKSDGRVHSWSTESVGPSGAFLCSALGGGDEGGEEGKREGRADSTSREQADRELRRTHFRGGSSRSVANQVGSSPHGINERNPLGT